jgi:hypothetical protein
MAPHYPLLRTTLHKLKIMSDAHTHTFPDAYLKGYPSPAGTHNIVHRLSKLRSCQPSCTLLTHVLQEAL